MAAKVSKVLLVLVLLANLLGIGFNILYNFTPTPEVWKHRSVALLVFVLVILVVLVLGLAWKTVKVLVRR